MTPFDERYGKILDLAESIRAHREKFIGRSRNVPDQAGAEAPEH